MISDKCLRIHVTGSSVSSKFSVHFQVGRNLMGSETQTPDASSILWRFLSSGTVIPGHLCEESPSEALLFLLSRHSFFISTQVLWILLLKYLRIPTSPLPLPLPQLRTCRLLVSWDYYDLQVQKGQPFILGP